jgi:pyruvate kinase
MSPRTKIVCTLGPAVDSKAKLKALIAAGMNVARINCSHGDWETREAWVKWIHSLQPKLSPVGILFDLQGPKIRIGKVEGGELKVRQGATVLVANRAPADVTVPDQGAWEAINQGDTLIIGDGGVALTAVERKGGAVLCSANNAGTIKSHQGLTLLGKSFDVPPLTDKDKKDLAKALELGADFVALSYVRNAEEILELKKLMAKKDKSVKAVAKIETREALKNVEGIVRAADVVMVARGDLGLQLALEDVPVAQKRIIAACNAAATPVVTATQMLESMLHAPRPTRAEASDVANAILDGTDAVMLSGETAVGDYPVEAVQTMAAIARRAEPLLDGRQRARKASTAMQDAETDSVALAAVGIASTLHIKAILTSSTSGMTPRLVSRYRPAARILCLSWDERTQRQLSVVWGVEAAFAKLPKGTDAAVAATVRAFARLKRVQTGEKVVVTAGVPAGVPGNTNMVLVLDV